MKTVSRTPGGLFTALFVLGGLAALYYYRKQGGELKPLLSRSTDFVRTAREKISAVAPAADETSSGVTSRSRAHEIPMAPEDLDRFPAT